MNGEGKKNMFHPTSAPSGPFLPPVPLTARRNTRCQVQEHTGHKAVVPEGQGYWPAISS